MHFVDPGSSGVSPGQRPSPRPVPSPSPVPAPAPSPTYPPRPGNLYNSTSCFRVSKRFDTVSLFLFILENVNFCKRRKGGTYADPDRCSGFIICNIGNTHRMTCGDGLLFNTHGMNCDLPGRVDCGDRPLDSPHGNQEDIQGQFGDPVTVDQETGSHRQQSKIQREESAREDRERNGFTPTREGNSEENADHPGKPNQIQEDKQSLKVSGKNSPNEFDDKLEAEDIQDTSSIQLGVDFPENKVEKSDDSTQTDPNRVKTRNSKEPVLHVLINGDTNLSPVSSSSKSDDEASKSRPSFQIMVNNDGIKASLGRQEERKKMDDTSYFDKPKHTFHVVINNDQRKRVHDEVEGTIPGARKQEGTVGGGEEKEISKPNFELTAKNNKDGVSSQKQVDNHGNNDLQGNEKQTMNRGSQEEAHSVPNIHDKEIPNGQAARQNHLLNTFKENVNEAMSVNEVKVQHLNGVNNGNEPGMNIEMLPSLPVHDQNISTNASQNIKLMSTQTSVENIPIRTPVDVSGGAAKVGDQSDINNSKEEIKKIQSKTQEDTLDKVTEDKKIKDKENEPQETKVPQSTYQEHLPLTTTVNKPSKDSHQETLTFKPPQTAFKHPLEALSFENQRQHPTLKEQLKVANGKGTEAHDIPLEHDSAESSEKKINEPGSEKEDKPEKDLDTSDVTTSQNSEGQGNVKRPTVDILVNGDNGRTTELRMRNNNNEIARMNDAGGKQATNRNPVIGITIRQKGGQDHHILFSKRQRLDKLRHHHKHH